MLQPLSRICSCREEYLLSMSCTGYRDGEFQVYHRLYDVCNVTVVSDKIP